MVNLPGFVLWLFLFVHLAYGQISDKIYTDKSSTDLDEALISINGTKAEGNEDEREEKAELEAAEEEIAVSEAVSERGERRMLLQKGNAVNVTEQPQMSPERRKSYLSIAERRKYYNRTRQAKPNNSQRDMLMYQETTNRPIVAHERMLLMNEIRENKQNTASKGFSKADDQRVAVGTNETLPKTVNVNQTVIWEFGQKLALRKPTNRGQEKPQRRKEKTKEDQTGLNSTNKIGKSVQTQSTKLIKVDESQWSTTKNPEVEAENFVMPWTQNKTGAEKVGKYIKSAYSQQKIVPVPLMNGMENATEVTTTEEVEVQTTTEANGSTIQMVNSTAAATSHFTLQPSTDPTVTTTTTTTTPTSTTASLKTTTTSSATRSFLTTPTTSSTTTLRPFFRKLYIPSVEYKTRFNYTRRPNYKTSNIITGNRTTGGSSSAATEATDVKRAKPPNPLYERKWRPPSTTKSPSKTPSTEEYPHTIEINENNKRVLSEMFRTTSALVPTTRTSTTESVPSTKVVTNATAKISDGETTAASTTSTQSIEPDDFGEDHKSVGTSFNTKFYIIPNVTKTEVIKIVEADDDAENEVLVTAQTVGIAIYILAAFGLIPLLLALVFGAKFFLQRHRRKDDCDSDLRSDISDSRGRQGKGTSELKKSPSNVTTTTLVAPTRLPRVHHWETYEKTPKTWEVWKAEVEDMPGHEGLARLVAVKTVKEGATEKEHGELIKELEIMQQIGSHPNIVTLLGCCTDQEPYYLIMEYVMYGKLLTYLREHRTNENYYNISNNQDALTSRDLTVFAYCVARGMEYLASKGIIHRDLAARNVLVDHNKLCKIADFGMSRSVRDSEDGQLYEERQHKGALPIRWMAPESLLYSLFTHKSDVWSFGIVMWEIVTLGSTPYPNMGAREVMRRVREGYRLERPPHCKHELYQLISLCWAHDPNKRPDFGELRRELANLLDDTSKDGIYVDLDSFAVSNRFHVANASKGNDFRLLERNEFKVLRRLAEWEGQDWPMESRKARSKRGRNNGKGTVTLTGHGSFTVNSRILEKEFKLV